MIKNAFLSRMSALLSADYPAFLAEMERVEPVRAFRVNLLKCPSGQVDLQGVCRAEPIDGCPNGYYTDWDHPGQSPEHHAGMIYMQDPGAMSTATALPIGRDFLILDACAAPGGKSAQLADAAPDGIIVSNEINRERARILLGNTERMGARRTVVTSLSSAELGAFYRKTFDLVLVDAPCSGEGMFRKNDLAVEEWSEENVRLCAARQKEILDNLADTVKPGGYLLYSTCTFSVEENEETLLRFVRSHPHFHAVPVKNALIDRTAPGIPIDGEGWLTLTRRFYPHISPGEGQYIALLRSDADAEPIDIPGGTNEKSDRSHDRKKKDYSGRTSRGNAPKTGEPRPLTAAEEKTVHELLDRLLTTIPHLPLVAINNRAFLSPPLPYPSEGILCPGVAVCDFSGERAVPHHQLYSAYGTDFRNRLVLHRTDPRLMAYLRGEEIEAHEAQNGYCAVLYESAPIGGGKVSGGMLKNHYPKGLRNHP